MDDTIEIFPEPKKRKRPQKSLKALERAKGEHGFTKKEIAIVKANFANPDASLVEKGKMAGLSGKDSTIASQVARSLGKVKEKTSGNQRFQELLQLKGAGMDKMAEVVAEALDAQTPFRGRETTVTEDGKLVTKDVTKMYPDHRVRMDAVKFSSEAQQLMPEKKQVVEVKTYEEKVAIIAEIKANPQEAMIRIQQLLEQRRRANESEGA